MQREETLEPPKTMPMFCEEHAQQAAMSTPKGFNDRHFATSKACHLASIKALCAELESPFDEIAIVYQEQLVRLGASASVTDYLPVFISKKVRAIYRERMKSRH